MQLAYSISGYKLPGQFRWLMEAVWHADDVFAVHVDANTPAAVFRAMQRVAEGRPNIHFIAREPIAYMGAGLIRAELRAIRHLLETAPRFDHLISLSMQDYPLKPRAAIVAELEAAPGLNHISREPLAELPFHVRRRPHLWSFEWRGRLVRTPLPRPIPRDIRIAYKGSWWRVLSRDFSEWLVRSPLAARYLAFLENVQAPDELFFQNLVMASPFKDRLADRNRHLALWSGRSGSPETLTMAHAERLLASPLWFARKFDENVDRAILHLLARHIGAPVPEEERDREATPAALEASPSRREVSHA